MPPPLLRNLKCLPTGLDSFQTSRQLRRLVGPFEHLHRLFTNINMNIHTSRAVLNHVVACVATPAVCNHHHHHQCCHDHRYHDHHIIIARNAPSAYLLCGKRRAILGGRAEKAFHVARRVPLSANTIFTIVALIYQLSKYLIFVRVFLNIGQRRSFCKFLDSKNILHKWCKYLLFKVSQISMFSPVLEVHLERVLQWTWSARHFSSAAREKIHLCRHQASTILPQNMSTKIQTPICNIFCIYTPPISWQIFISSVSVSLYQIVHYLLLLLHTFGSTSGEQGWLPRAVRCPRDLLFFFRLMIECFWNILQGDYHALLIIKRLSNILNLDDQPTPSSSSWSATEEEWDSGRKELRTRQISRRLNVCWNLDENLWVVAGGGAGQVPGGGKDELVSPTKSPLWLE